MTSKFSLEYRFYNYLETSPQCLSVVAWKSAGTLEANTDREGAETDEDIGRTTKILWQPQSEGLVFKVACSVLPTLTSLSTTPEEW